MKSNWFNVEQVSLVFSGWERVFPLCEFARGVGAACESMDTIPPVLCSIAEIHSDGLSIAGLAVNFAVGVGSLQILPTLV